MCFQDWMINGGLQGEVSESARPKEKEGKRERCRSAESVCDLCATDDFPSGLFALTRFSLARQ